MAGAGAVVDVGEAGAGRDAGLGTGGQQSAQSSTQAARAALPGRGSSRPHTDNTSMGQHLVVLRIEEVQLRYSRINVERLLQEFTTKMLKQSTHWVRCDGDVVNDELARRFGGLGEIDEMTFGGQSDTLY